MVGPIRGPIGEANDWTPDLPFDSGRSHDCGHSTIVDTLDDENVFDDAFGAFPSSDNDQKQLDNNNAVGDDDPFSSFGDF